MHILKTLFIVDIQNKYKNSFNEDYLNKVIDFIKKEGTNYEKIILIMEENIENGDYRLRNNTSKQEAIIKILEQKHFFDH